MKFRRSIVLALLALGCSQKTDGGAAKQEPAAAAGAATAAAPQGQAGATGANDAGAGAAGSVAPSGDPAIKDHMQEHFAVVSSLQRAIARGHLKEAQDLAKWLANHPEPAIDAWKPYVGELKTAAREVAAAADVPTAAALVPRLGRACSSCHQAMGAVVAFSWEPAPDASDALPAQMLRHQWAAARLWDGLVGPSDALWAEGAAVLATTKLDATGAAGGNPRGDVAALAAKVRELGAAAAKIKGQEERTKFYGELLTTCAGCHALVRPQPVKP